MFQIITFVHENQRAVSVVADNTDVFDTLKLKNSQILVLSNPPMKARPVIDIMQPVKVQRNAEQTFLFNFCALFGLIAIACIHTLDLLKILKMSNMHNFRMHHNACFEIRIAKYVA